jgi:hypothetical protein
MSSRLAILLALCCLSAGAQERTPLILGWGTYIAPHDGRHDGQDHGLQAATYCGASPESWVRGSAALSLGWLSLTLELETDSPQAGPKGRLYVTLSKGCLHPVHGGCDPVHDPLVKLYTVETDEVSIGGKSRGGDTGIIRRSASVDNPRYCSSPGDSRRSAGASQSLKARNSCVHPKHSNSTDARKSENALILKALRGSDRIVAKSEVWLLFLSRRSLVRNAEIGARQ